MPRSFKTVDYELALDTSVRLRDCLPPAHLARYVADLIAYLDLTAFYARYAPRGGVAYAPDLLLSLLFYGYATGIFSSRKIEAATYDQAPFRFLAGHQHPDHDTLATFPARSAWAGKAATWRSQRAWACVTRCNRCQQSR